MHGSARAVLIFTAFLLLIAPGQAQQNYDDVPRPIAPKRPADPAEARRRQALERYAEGIVYEHEDRLLEALKAFEEATRLDPSSSAPYKAQIGLLLALDRPTDALVASRKTVELDADDREVWYVLARLLRSSGKQTEAIEALQHAIKVTDVQDSPELAQQLHHDLGELQEQAGSYAAAAKAFTKAAQILEHPDLLLEKSRSSREAILNRAAETYERVGTLSRKARDYDGALAAYRKAQERAPSRAGRLSLNMAQLCQEQERWNDALTHVDAYLRLQPLGNEAYEMKVTLLQRLEQSDKIVPWLEKAAAADHHNTGLQLLLAREYGRAHQSAEAEKLYRTLAEHGPSTEIYRGWLQLYLQTNALPKALQVIEETLKRASDRSEAGAVLQAKGLLGALREEREVEKALLPVATRALGRGDAMSYETLSLFAFLADRQRANEDAERFYRKCLPLARQNNDALLYAGLLRVLNRQRKYEEVLKVCEEALAKAPPTSWLLFYSESARAHAAMQHYEEALRQADRAIEAAGEETKLTLRLLRLRILNLAQRYAAAERECLALLDKATSAGDVLELRYVLSTIYAASKQSAKSEEQLKRILESDPSNATANNDLGYVWAEQGKNLAQAEEMIRKAIDADRRQRKQTTDLNPSEDHDHAAFVDSLGWVLFRRGDREAARKELERAAGLPDSDDPVIYDHLGDVYQSLGQLDQARTAWERALHLYESNRHRPTDERYHEVQRKLREARARAEAR